MLAFGLTALMADGRWMETDDGRKQSQTVERFDSHDWKKLVLNENTIVLGNGTDEGFEEEESQFIR
jgi:hypothetical protein